MQYRLIDTASSVPTGAGAIIAAVARTHRGSPGHSGGTARDARAEVIDRNTRRAADHRESVTDVVLSDNPKVAACVLPALARDV